jgi:hypothetical protein
MMISKSSLWTFLAVAGTGTTTAFVPSSLVHRIAQHQKTPHQWRAATIDETTNIATSTTTSTTNANKELMTWECDDEAQCAEVPACDEEQCRTSLDVRIHGEWYDLTGP